MKDKGKTYLNLIQPTEIYNFILQGCMELIKNVSKRHLECYKRFLFQINTFYSSKNLEK